MWDVNPYEIDNVEQGIMQTTMLLPLPMEST